MLIDYARVSKADGSQLLDLQMDALVEAGVVENRIYSDRVSGKTAQRPGLDACLKALQPGNTLVVWKLGDVLDVGITFHKLLSEARFNHCAPHV